MMDLPLDIETKAFLLSFLGAFAGLFTARGITLAAEWWHKHRRGRSMNAWRGNGFGLGS